jgi:RHS repeat-associated protein
LAFGGQLLDVVTGLYDLRARMYDPTTGRFLQQDPARADLDNATYVYAGDRPTVAGDPSGLDWGCFGNWCVSDAAKGVANFGAGAANLATTFFTLGQVHVHAPFHGPGLGASYVSGEWTAGIEGVLGGIRSLPYNLESALFGWNSWLFGRGGVYSACKGILNGGVVRIGWGFKTGVGKVFRIALGPILGKKLHIDLWP